MAQPPGFEDANHPNLVCYFYKSLYGLKQALGGLHHYFQGIQITRNEYGFPRQSMFMICYLRLRCLSPKPVKLLNCHTTYCLRMMANLMEN